MEFGPPWCDMIGLGYIRTNALGLMPRALGTYAFYTGIAEYE